MAKSTPIQLKKAFNLPRAFFHKPSQNKEALSLRAQLSIALVEELDLKGIIVSENLQLQHTIGDLSGILNFPAGDFSSNIFDFLNPAFRVEFRSVARKCLESNERQKSRTIRVEEEDSTSAITLIAKPLGINETGQVETLMIVFQPVTPEPIVETSSEYPSPSQERTIRSLELELTDTKESLQSATEELETSNEELQSLNEELQSSNEELQSSNEELETSNEELQSTNEELTTVNEELQVKTSELETTVGDVENLMRVMGFAVIVVDKSFRVTRFNESARDFVTGGKIDMGEAIFNVAMTFSWSSLRNDLNEVIKNDKVREQEFVIEKK